MLLEQGKLTCGTTWHAAGLVGQTRAEPQHDADEPYGIELYATLEAETGLATGWKQCGSVNVAAHAGAAEGAAAADGAGAELRRRVRVRSARARPASCSRSCAPTTSPARSGSRATARPTRPTSRMSLAKGARTRGARIVEGVEVTGVAAETTGRVDRRRRARAHDGEERHRLRDRRQLRRPVGARSSARSPASTCRCSRPSTSTSSPSRSTACIRCCR